jgi:hypothetical protein
MVDESELPSSPAERATMMENLMEEHATGGTDADTYIYEHLRREFMADPATKDLLPNFVRTSRTLSAFWPWIKNEATKPEPMQIVGGYLWLMAMRTTART